MKIEIDKNLFARKAMQPFRVSIWLDTRTEAINFLNAMSDADLRAVWIKVQKELFEQDIVNSLGYPK